jgi:hypothetical protein
LKERTAPPPASLVPLPSKSRGGELTHGREEALKHWCMTHQINACELNLVGYEDEDD